LGLHNAVSNTFERVLVNTNATVAIRLIVEHFRQIINKNGWSTSQTKVRCVSVIVPTPSSIP